MLLATKGARIKAGQRAERQKGRRLPQRHARRQSPITFEVLRPGIAIQRQRARPSFRWLSETSVEGTGREPARVDLDLGYLLRLQSFGTLGHTELYGITLVQRSESFCLDGRVVHENVIAGGALDESVTLGVVKPLHRTLFSGHNL